MSLYGHDAPVGLPELPRRTGATLSHVSSENAGRGHRADGGRRTGCRRAGQDSRKRAGDSRRFGRGRGWPEFDCPGLLRLEGQGHRRPNGRAVDANVQKTGRSGHDLSLRPEGKALVVLNRGDYWQGAFLIPKGSYEG